MLFPPGRRGLESRRGAANRPARPGASRARAEQRYIWRSESMKGIILAGGSGTRLYPADAGRLEADAADLRQADDLLPARRADAGRHPRDPDHLDAARPAACSAACSATAANSAFSLSYAEQPQPNGLAEAFIIGRDFVGDEPRRADPRRQHLLRRRPVRALPRRRRRANSGATVFAYHVEDPERYGVVAFDRETGQALDDRGEAGRARSRTGR